MLEQKLAQFRRRLRLASAVQWGTVGWLIGLVTVVALAVASMFRDDAFHLVWILIPLTCTSVAAIAGLMRRFGNDEVATMIDSSGRLKDRAVTMLANQTEDDGHNRSLTRLQAAEAVPHIELVDAHNAVPLNPRTDAIAWSVGLLGTLLLLGAIQAITARRSEARLVPTIATHQAAGLSETLIPEVEKAIEAIDDPKIDELLRELKDQIQQMENEASDEAEVMVKLSEMEQAISAAQMALNVEAGDAMMSELAEALEPSELFQPVAESLKKQDYDRAAKQLDKVDPTQMSDGARRAVAQRLRQMTSVSKSKSTTLSKTVGELSEAMQRNDTSKCKQCLSKLAKACKKQGNCKKCGQCLSRQLSLLSQCKAQCRGQCDSPFARKSDRPSLSAGKAASDTPLGDSTARWNVTYDRKEVTGKMGDSGDRDTELTTTTEANQNASRGYTKRYNEFKRAAEEVLQSEPLPQSHRQTVRDYFEAIRPDQQTDAHLEVAQ